MSAIGTGPRIGPVPRVQPDADGREAYCAGLEALAAYLRANPGVPVPHHGTRICCAVENRAGVEAAAAVFGVEPKHSPAQHAAVRSFGPVGYHVWAPNFGEGS